MLGGRVWYLIKKKGFDKDPGNYIGIMLLS